MASLGVATAGLALVLTAHPEAIAQFIPPDREPPASDSYEGVTVSRLNPAVVNAQTQFGFNLFSEVRQGEGNENVVLSPSSVAIALSMVYNGADGATQEAMAEALALQNLSLDDVNLTNAELIANLENADPETQVSIANALWGNEGVPFEADFLEHNTTFYQAEVNTLNFADPGSLTQINNWVSDQTNGKIPDILSSLQADDMLVLVNAIYFKGSWTDEFNPRQTRDRPFYLADGTEISHPQMVRSDEFRYLENDQFQAVRLPYGRDRLSMYVFLPRGTASNTEAFYSNLNADNWRTWMSQFQSREGTLYLPRFTVEYDTALKDALSALGMADAFNPNAANFARLSPQPAYIDSVQHKTFIEVNEEGTEAAAATSVTIAPTSIAIPTVPPFEMNVDRPFFFAIQDDQTGTVLFMGSILNPQG